MQNYLKKCGLEGDALHNDSTFNYELLEDDTARGLRKLVTVGVHEGLKLVTPEHVQAAFTKTGCLITAHGANDTDSRIHPQDFPEDFVGTIRPLVAEVCRSTASCYALSSIALTRGVGTQKARYGRRAC